MIICYSAFILIILMIYVHLDIVKLMSLIHKADEEATK